MTGRHSEDSKKNFALMRDRILEQQGQNYWRSLDELVDAPEFEEFVNREFPQHAETWDDPVSRRSFMKIMGASLALAGLSSACVIQPPEKVIPYVRQPEEIIPGKALFFATAMTLKGIATGLLAKSNEGRPTKIEGNPEHPGSLGATDRFAQASLLDMYDPDRSQDFLFRNEPRSWDRFVTDIRAAVEDQRKNGGAGVRFLSETVTSPTLIAQFAQIARELPQSRWYQYEPCNGDNAMQGAKLAFGENVHTVYNFAAADRVLSLDADFLSDFNVRYVQDFSNRRRVTNEKKDINRLYVVETTPTITGAKADHRLSVKPSQMEGVAKAIAAALGVSGASGDAGEHARWVEVMAADLRATTGRSIIIAGDNQPAVIHALAHAMNAALGNIGKTLTYHEPIVANTSGADAKTQVEGLRELVTDIDNGAVQMLVILGGNPMYNAPADLAFNEARMDKVPLRIHLSTHVNETSRYCHWHVPQTHYLEQWSDSRAFDGTATLTQPLIAPLYGGKSAHEVVNVFAQENYDRNGFDIVREFWQRQGMGGTVRPLVAISGAGAAKPTATPAASPTAGGNQGNQSNTTTQQQSGNNAASTGNLTTQRQSTPQALPMGQGPTSVQQQGGGDVPRTQQSNATTGSSQTASTTVSAPTEAFDRAWRKAIHDGFIPGTTAQVRNAAPNTGFLAQPVNIQAASGNQLEVIILPDPSVYDGRFANNGWLQELPKPLTKLTWDNVMLVSPRTAEKYGLNSGRGKYENDAGAEEGVSFINSTGGNLLADTVKLKFNGQEISQAIPVWVMPGQPDDTATIYLGFGRKNAGRVGNGIGYNAYEIRTSNAMGFGLGEITRTGATYALASTQTHFNMEGRDILRVFEIDEYVKDPHLGEQHNEMDKSMYPGYNYSESEWQHKWGMAIDLNSCVGCNACVIACQSENNIPVVGKEQVQRSREMHWLRVDTYFEGDQNNPAGPHFQPVLCQQCEQAPCEPVCPVHATVHSEEGLNDMVYNRCIGTRYCSNNCPYKVRRFNFLLYQDWNTPQYKLMRNPEVSVRSRGVMEKCTYCTQRLALARIEAQKDGGRRVRDGEATTACQTACPANAIVFGDLNDPNSAVSKLKKEGRNYNLLNELNTQPRTTYLSSVKNMNKEMPGYQPLKKPVSHHKDESHGGDTHSTPSSKEVPHDNKGETHKEGSH